VAGEIAARRRAEAGSAGGDGEGDGPSALKKARAITFPNAAKWMADVVAEREASAIKALPPLARAASGAGKVDLRAKVNGVEACRAAYAQLKARWKADRERGGDAAAQRSAAYAMECGPGVHLLREDYELPSPAGPASWNDGVFTRRYEVVLGKVLPALVPTLVEDAPPRRPLTERARRLAGASLRAAAETGALCDEVSQLLTLQRIAEIWENHDADQLASGPLPVVL